jgi:hypothetical protein
MHAAGELTSETYIVGKTSGASCLVRGVSSVHDFPNYDIARDPEHPDHALHKNYFIFSDIFSMDKLIDKGPEIISTYEATQYIPWDGTEIQNVDLPQPQDLSPMVLAADKQVQGHPLSMELPETQQFVPSVNPGYFRDWSDKVGADKVVWGWKDEGIVNANNPAVTFDSPTDATELKNLHIGIRVRAHKDYHYTHGFVNFEIPKPVIKSVSPLSSATDLRIEGYYFVDYDHTQTQIPITSPPAGGPYGFDGTVGGCWIFLRHSSKGTEVPVEEVIFETGIHPGKYVNGLHGSITSPSGEVITQKSDGHVLEVHIPNLPFGGSYDIIVRNYRPYQYAANGTTYYHMDEAVSANVYYHTQLGGFAGIPWGTGPLGGGG